MRQPLSKKRKKKKMRQPIELSGLLFVCLCVVCMIFEAANYMLHRKECTIKSKVNKKIVLLNIPIFEFSPQKTFFKLLVHPKIFIHEISLYFLVNSCLTFIFFN